ncbi:unnamed protein product, partial [Ectocarpus sp. 12 AP-2014]
ARAVPSVATPVARVVTPVGRVVPAAAAGETAGAQALASAAAASASGPATTRGTTGSHVFSAAPGAGRDARTRERSSGTVDGSGDDRSGCRDGRDGGWTGLPHTMKQPGRRRSVSSGTR